MTRQQLSIGRSPVRSGLLGVLSALVMLAWPDTMYADADGNIGYIYNSAVPRRLPGIDPSGILNGSDPRTEWQGFHLLDELPQVWNPPTGWLLNTNSTPFTATTGLTLRREDFPPYMVASFRPETAVLPATAITQGQQRRVSGRDAACNACGQAADLRYRAASSRSGRASPLPRRGAAAEYTLFLNAVRAADAARV
jgi:hypothetical protein